MQLKFSTMLFWLFSMAGTTVSGRFHCDACGKRQTTSWIRVNNAIIQVHCKVRFTLGKQEIPARPNSKDVRVGDKLKVVQFQPVIRNNSTPSPKIINFGWHQLGVLWIRNTSISDVRCRKNTKKTGSANKRQASIAVFSGFALRHQSYSHCPWKRQNSESCKISWCSANFNSVTLLNRAV